MMNKLLSKHVLQTRCRRKALLLSLVLAFLLTPLLALQETPAAADGWVIECVDCPPQFLAMTDRSLQLDAEGHPHIAYGGGHLYYAYNDGANWHYETVDDSPGVGRSSSLALDEDGDPHISYYNYTNHDLKYAYQDGSGWHIETVDSEGDVCTSTSLALDGSGYPHISYYDSTNEDLRYAYQDASGWHIQTVDTELGAYGGHISLAVDGNGYAHISYYDDTNDDLKYAHQDGSGWHIETVDNEGDVGTHTSLALDEGGYPHISYYYCGTPLPFCDIGDLKYAHQDASGWHIETVDSEGYVGWSTSLALDGGGYPHISYYYCGTSLPFCDIGDLKYAHQDASGWHIEIVDSEGDVGRSSSLALDESGHPHISYYYCGTLPFSCDIGDLKYVHQDASGWHIETVDSEERVGEDTSLALDKNGHPHISYCDSPIWHADSPIWHALKTSPEAAGTRSLKYAHQDAFGWHIQTVDSEGDVGYTSLALDGDGYPHLSYFDSTNDDLKYAYQDDSGWHIQTVDTGLGIYGGQTSLALDRGGYPHISYYDATKRDLKYAYQDASGWHIQTVDSEGDVGYCTSLALDRNKYPHISYFDSTNEDLKYAYQDDAGWHIQTVDTDLVFYIGQTSLALDRGGYPHISYYDATKRELEYACQDDFGWHIETVDTGLGLCGGYTSLALDGNGYPHISYFDSTNEHLKYTYQDASGWHIEVVDTGLGSDGGYTSLALDGGGYPHISYHDDTNGDLKYAYYSAPWLNWHDPDRPLLLLPRGTTVDVVYGNIPIPAILTATLSGPAIFADESQVFHTDIIDANGSYTLQLKPEAGVTPGAPFTLEVTLDGLQLERVGTIAWQVYLPLILKEGSMTP
jgi:hypothetical protein